MTKNQDEHIKNWISFEEAKAYARSLKLLNRNQWFNHCSKGNMPGDIPRNPDYVYKKVWKGWGDWLGTGRLSPKDRTFRPFHQAREYVHKLGLKNKEEWSEYSKSRNRPADVPSLPPRTYKKYWKGWGDWLGTGYIATSERKYRQFNDAREFAQSPHMKSSM